MRVRLKHERLAQELAQSPLTLNRWARRMHLSSGHLSQLANGQRLYPTAATREKLLAGLGLEFDDLFELEPPKAGDARTRPSEQAQPAPASRFSEAGASQPQLRSRARFKEHSMSGWRFDLRCAARSLLKRPGYAAFAIATLALGIGANVALFTAVNAVLFKAYPYEQPDRLYAAYSTTVDSGSRGSLSLPNAVEIRERLVGLMDLTAFDWEPFSLAGGDRPLRVGGGQVMSNYARVIGVAMLQGRFFTEEEAQTRAPVLVLGEALWRNSFGSDPAIIGRVVDLDGVPSTVVGVAPAELDAIEDTQLFVPLPLSMDSPRGSRWLGAFARLEKGASLPAVRDRFEQIALDLERSYPTANKDRRYFLVGLREDRVGPVRTMFLTLQAVVGVVLLIVCANVANLLLSRGASRRDELRLRSALGASRVALGRLVVFESLWIGLGGFLFGGLLGLWGSRALLDLFPDAAIPEWLSPSPDGRVLAFTVLTALLAILISAAGPALRYAGKLHHAPSLSTTRGAVGGRSRKGLVVAQVALSCVLLFGAGLLVRSLLELSSRDTGFEQDNAVVLGLDLLSVRRASLQERERHFLEYYRAFRDLPRSGGSGCDRPHSTRAWTQPLRSHGREAERL